MLFARIACLLLLAPAGRAADCDAPLPLQRKDPGLQTALQRTLRGAGYERPLAKKELTVALLDLTHRGERYYAGVNDDFMLYAASLPKIGILLSVIESVERGDVEWKSHYPYQLRKMITISDNQYATWARS